MKKAFIFPGQGSQFVGMGKELAAAYVIARDTFAEIDEALNQNLSKIIFEGPIEELTLTENTQPALMAVSMALIRTIKQQTNIELNAHCSYIAGHSLGEYTALAAGGALTITDAAKLLKIRGKAMQDAVPPGKGAMAAIIGADFELAQSIALEAAENEVCQIANYNSAEQIVLSGDAAAIDRAIKIAGKHGKRAVKLNVSAPFHSLLMSKASIIMQQALQEINLTAPIVPLIANITAKEVIDADEIKSLLVQQVTGMVRWYDTILHLKEQGMETIVEIGAGKVLGGLTKRIDKEIHSISIQGPDDIGLLI